jgi:rhodanese-related sulfurtransferase
MKKILIEDLNELEDINIIDLRDKEDYELGHILNAFNIPKKELLRAPDNYLEKDKKYYLYCEVGLLSREACTELEGKFDVINCIGGYKKWKETDL